MKSLYLGISCAMCNVLSQLVSVVMLQVDGKEVPGPVFDFGLLMFHNAARLAKSESGPFFYLSKVSRLHVTRKPVIIIYSMFLVYTCMIVFFGKFASKQLLLLLY